MRCIIALVTVQVKFSSVHHTNISTDDSANMIYMEVPFHMRIYHYAQILDLVRSFYDFLDESNVWFKACLGINV